MNTTLHVTIDRETKKRAQRLAEELGLDLSTVVRASVKQFVQTESFSVAKTRRMTPYLEKIIAEAESTPDAVSPTFTNSKDAMNYLLTRK